MDMMASGGNVSGQLGGGGVQCVGCPFCKVRQSTFLMGWQGQKNDLIGQKISTSVQDL